MDDDDHDGRGKHDQGDEAKQPSHENPGTSNHTQDQHDQNDHGRRGDDGGHGGHGQGGDGGSEHGGDRDHGK